MVDEWSGKVTTFGAGMERLFSVHAYFFTETRAYQPPDGCGRLIVAVEWRDPKGFDPRGCSSRHRGALGAIAVSQQTALPERHEAARGDDEMVQDIHADRSAAVG